MRRKNVINGTKIIQTTKINRPAIWATINSELVTDSTFLYWSLLTKTVRIFKHHVIYLVNLAFLFAQNKFSLV